MRCIHPLTGVRWGPLGEIPQQPCLSMIRKIIPEKCETCIEYPMKRHIEIHIGVINHWFIPRTSISKLRLSTTSISLSRSPISAAVRRSNAAASGAGCWISAILCSMAMMEASPARRRLRCAVAVGSRTGTSWRRTVAWRP